MPTVNSQITGEPYVFDRKTRKSILAQLGVKQLQPAAIPRDPAEFVKDFGGIPHKGKKSIDGKPFMAKELTWYQYEAWKYPGDLYFNKGNRMGVTTSFSLEDFQTRLLPEEAGSDVLFVSQNDKMSSEHIKELKKLIRGSYKYRKYLVERKSTDSVLTIANPYDPDMESRIIGVGKSEGMAYSWPNINRVHMSDVSLMDKLDQKTFFSGIYSRVAMSNGVVKIESIPNGQMGEIYAIYLRCQEMLKKKKGLDASDVQEAMKSLKENEDDLEEPTTMFHYMEVPTTEAVKAGLVKQSFLDSRLRELGQLYFEQAYMCKFVAPGNQFYKREWLTQGTRIL